MSGDVLVRVSLKEPAMRLVFGDFRNLAAEGIVRHDADPVAGRLLADALSAAALLTATQFAGERDTIRFGYSGSAGSAVTDADSTGAVRGFVKNPHVMPGANSLEEACGADGATIRFTRSKAGKIVRSGESKNAFLLPSEALACHLSISEDVESEIRCDLTLRPDPANPVENAYGVLLQAQGCDLEAFDKTRNRLHLPEVAALLKACAENPEAGTRALLAFLLEEAEVPEHKFQLLPVARFHCGCTAEHLRKTALQMLGREELAKLLAENPNPALRCQFCNEEYRLTAADLS